MADQRGLNLFLTSPGTNPSSLSHTWELHRPTIKELYVNRGEPLSEVMKIMERDHDFRASKKVYRKRLSKWGIEKKIKGPEMRAVVRKIVERGAMGKMSVFTVRDVTVVSYQIENYLKRSRKSVHEIMSSGDSDLATLQHLRCTTPDPWDPESKIFDNFIWRHAEDIEAYKRRLSGNGNPAAEPQPQDDTSPKATASNGDSQERGNQALS